MLSRRAQQVNDRDCMRRLPQQQSSWSQCAKTSLHILCSPPEKPVKSLPTFITIVSMTFTQCNDLQTFFNLLLFHHYVQKKKKKKYS